MWSTEISPTGSLLQVRFAGDVSPGEARACAAQVEALAGRLKPGFCLLTDLSDLETMDIASGPLIDGMMDLLNERGVRKVVRVVSDPRKDIGFGIMGLFHYDREVRTIVCETLDEAKKHLPQVAFPSSPLNTAGPSG